MQCSCDRCRGIAACHTCTLWVRPSTDSSAGALDGLSAVAGASGWPRGRRTLLVLKKLQRGAVTAEAQCHQWSNGMLIGMPNGTERRNPRFMVRHLPRKTTARDQLHPHQAQRPQRISLSHLLRLNGGR